jgi:hypothetical protein
MNELRWVYIAGPYTGGDTVVNVRNAILAGMRIRRLGYVPIIPHLFMLAHAIEPESYEFWMSWDADLLNRCDALIRLPGESSGADDEVTQAEQTYTPVFNSVEEFCRAMGKTENKENRDGSATTNDHNPKRRG